MEQIVRHALWEAMAELFLDTETRYQIPAVAGRCVRARLGARAAREIWRYEVTPTVWPNLWSVAGEWAYWPTEWLVPRIERRGRRGCALSYFLVAWQIEPVWRAIAACIDVLGACPHTESAMLEAELTWLARVFFDFVPGPWPASRGPEVLRRVYQETFSPIFNPLAVNDAITGESLGVCRTRVERALDALPMALRL